MYFSSLISHRRYFCCLNESIHPSSFFCRPLDLFPCRDCHSVILFFCDHLLSSTLVICPITSSFLGESKFNSIDHSMYLSLVPLHGTRSLDISYFLSIAPCDVLILWVLDLLYPSLAPVCYYVEDSLVANVSL